MQGEWAPLWVVDFPMFEYDEDEQRWSAMHHPFTRPKDGHEDWLETDPGRCIAKAYDIVLNGCEIGGGSVRIHREDVQSKVFRALKIGADEAHAKFGFLLDALQYGAPPHGGIAFGLDRFVMLMTGAESHPRRDRVPEDAARAGPAHARAEPGRREAAARAAHPAAQHAGAGLSVRDRSDRRTGPALHWAHSGQPRAGSRDVHQQGRLQCKTTATNSRRDFLMTAAGTGLAAMSGVAGAQSFDFKPNQRYPDPAVQILDPSFARYRIYSSTVEQVATGMRWAEGPVYFPATAATCWSATSRTTAS